MAGKRQQKSATETNNTYLHESCHTLRRTGIASGQSRTKSESNFV
ncbi:hypothetical protein [Lacinutrix salivirga]